MALHFVTENLDHLDEDGIDWQVDYGEAHAKLHSKMHRAIGGDLFSIAEFLEEVETYEQMRSRFDQGHVSGAVFFEPPSLDGRIVNQYVLFSVLPDPKQRFDEWLLHHPDLYERYRIPNSIKMKIRDKLDASNITERVLSPSFGGLADWLTRYYKQIEEGQTTPPSEIYPEQGQE